MPYQVPCAFPWEQGRSETVLDDLRDHLVGEVGAHTADLAVVLALIHAEAVEANTGEDDKNEHRRIGANLIRHWQKSGQKITESETHKAGQHTGGDKETLEEFDFRTEQLTQHNKDRGYRKIK